MMRNPDFRVDYGPITSCHMVNPNWDKPIVGLSSNAAFFYFGNDVGQQQMIALGDATRRAVEKSGRRAILLASNSLSHRHFTVEPTTPEDMSHEHIYHHGQYLWDMRMLEHMREGRAKQVVDEIPDFIDQTESESNAGCLTWLLAALGFPDYPAEVYAYGTVIGTGNAVVEWDPRGADASPSQAPPRAAPTHPTPTPEPSANVRAAAARRDRAVAAGRPSTAPRRRANDDDGRGAGHVVAGYVVPGLPHAYLAPERCPAWQAIRGGFERVRREIEALDADLLLLYSTQWISVIGHQIQAHPQPEWVHVDPDWHELGSMPYRLKVDSKFGDFYQNAARERGLHARTVSYDGFPVDTGTVVALRLLNPDNRLAASVVSCNMYADRAETIVLGKAAADATRRSGRRVIGVAVTALSNRMFTEPIDPAQDHISSLKDDEWNRKLLAILGEGRLEDVAQLARQFTEQANGDRKLKAIWWLAALMGQHNNYRGEVFEYQPIWGTGAALVGLVPSGKAASNLEFDEENVEVYGGDRSVLERAHAAAPARSGGVEESQRPAEPPTGVSVAAAAAATSAAVRTDAAPRPVGAYPHARRVGDLLYLSGIGPRQAGTDEIPGGPVRDAAGAPLDYDVEAQTRAAIENVRAILAAAGSSLQRVVDVTVFLVDMDRDFESFNNVYAEFFAGIDAARTTVEVRALPTPIAVEFKVIANCGPDS
jgi:reactive intermediate/imine deaminase